MIRCSNFSIEELVCDHALKKYKEDFLWSILDDKFKVTIDVIRDLLGKPMLCNYGDFHQRGLRCNMCDIVKSKKSVYMSAHCLGKAGDFTITGMSAEEARNIIIANKNVLPYPIRLEHLQNGKPISWLHVDVYEPLDGSKVYLFNT